MKSTVIIELKINDITGMIEALSMIRGAYDRTEFVTEDVDEPVTVRDALEEIREELDWRFML